MKPTNTVAKLFSSVSTLAVLAGAMALNGVAWGQAGSVIAWGYNYYGQCLGTDINGNAITSTPTGQPVKIMGQVLTGVSAIARGQYISVALKNGAVLAWGSNYFGECNIPDSANSGVSAIAGGEGLVLALKGGSVFAWGNNSNGQCLGTDINGNAITSTPTGQPVKIMGQVLTGVSAIVGGGLHALALKNGGVIAWGSNGERQCTIPDTAQSGVSAIAGGTWHSIALKGGSVIAWGSNYFGECNIPATAQSGVSAIAGGEYNTIALKNGTVFVWGSNSFGERNIPTASQSDVTAIAGGVGGASTARHALALKNGGVIAWGSNGEGQCTIPDTAQSGVSAIAGGFLHTIALKGGDPNDIDGDGIPNATDNCPSVVNPTQADCDGNGVGDACELDCNHNGFADVCEILSGAVTDQNLNGIPDTCEVSSVTRVQPISGPSTGGTAVRITGTNFFSALPVSVTFGGAPATDVVVVSLTEITAVTPSGSPGDTFVAVNGAGAEEFYYRPSCDGDLDNNGTIDSSDLGLMLVNYGNCYESAVDAPQEPMIFPKPEVAKPVAVKK